MTFGASVAWSAARALLLALVGLWCAKLWSNWIDAAPAGRERRRWGLILIPALVPELLLGMAYARMVAGRPLWAELALSVLVGLRSLAVGVVVWRLTPAPALTPSAWYLRRMTWTSPPTWWEWLAYQRAGWLGQQLPTFVLLFLLVFQEFELAALFRAASWTDWLFVAQVGGLPLSSATWLALGPTVGQVVLVSLVNWRFTGGPLREPQPCSRRDEQIARGLVLLTWIALVLIPVGGLAVTLPAGFLQLLGQALRWQGLLRELLGGTALALCAACGAWMLVSMGSREFSRKWGVGLDRSRFVTHLILMACFVLVIELVVEEMRKNPTGWVQTQGQQKELLGSIALVICVVGGAWMLSRSRSREPSGPLSGQSWASRQTLAMTAAPGLLGSLVLALLVLNVFQHDAFSDLYDTPIPWCIACLLFLIPRAAVLQQWTAASSSALMIAEQLAHSAQVEQQRSGRRLLWQLRDEPRFLAICCLTYWASLEVTLAGLLAPTGLTAGVVRLYNFLHFGRTAALSAEMAILLGGPIALAALVWGLLRRGRV